MKLIRPSVNYKNEYFEYIEEIKKNNDQKKIGYAMWNENETFENMWIRIEKMQDSSKLIGMMKPTSVFWIVNDNKIVGSMNLRESLNEFTYYTIGNVGYYIRPSFRNKGYATEALRLAKEYYKSIKKDRILLICTDDNIASEKVILKNGGKFELEILAFDGIHKLKRYWIEL